MLAIIPARGGSKGLPGKNIKSLCGKPLIAYTIEAAKTSQCIDRVVLSTDDDEIANVGRRYGAEVPFMRPADLAQDDSSVVDTYIYTIEQLNKDADQPYEEFVVLQPTVPLRFAEDIDGAVKLFKEKNADSVISCTEPHHPPGWMLSVSEDGIIQKNDDGVRDRMTNRQAIDYSYTLNGAVFVLKYSLVKETYSYYFPKTYAYIMPQERSVDIDTPIDFKFAEFLMQNSITSEVM